MEVHERVQGGRCRDEPLLSLVLARVASPRRRTLARRAQRAEAKAASTPLAAAGAPLGARTA
eukprot:8806140-Lingulodinium_polyedra.AAC.1